MSRQFSRRNVLRGTGTLAAGATVASVAPWTGAAAAPQRHSIRAHSVPEFLRSLGVCTHIGQGVDDAAGVAGALSHLGIYNVRDDSHVDAIPKWLELHRRSGARVDLIAQSNSVEDTITIADRLAASGALLAIEGPNEPNNQPVTYNGQTSDHTTDFFPVAYYCQELYRRVKGDRALRRFPVFASSEAGGSEPNNVGLQFLTIPQAAGTLMPDGTVFADFANTHTYPNRSPGWTDNLAWNVADPILNGAWDGLYVEFGRTWYGGFAGYPTSRLATLPRVMTETGWATAGSDALTEDQQGRLILALYLANFTRGWANTFIYMLRDDPVQGYWGLIDTEYNTKPSGDYVHNLTTILSDDRRATVSHPKHVDYCIPGKPDEVHDVVMQKSNGELYLIVWNEQASGSASVSVDFGGHRSVRVYDPAAGTTAIRSLPRTKSVPLTLNGYDCRILRL